MKIKNIVGENAFQTAEMVYTVVQVHEEGKVDVDVLIQCIDSVSIMGIKDVAFADTLFQYLVRNQKNMEAFVELFFEHYTTGMTPMQALSATQIKIGEVFFFNQRMICYYYADIKLKLEGIGTLSVFYGGNY